MWLRLASMRLPLYADSSATEALAAGAALPLASLAVRNNGAQTVRPQQSGNGPMVRLLAALALVAMLPTAFGGELTTVTVETDVGTFDIRMLPESAPATVANFLAYVRGGHYDGTFFHRSEPGFVVQGGGFRFDAVTTRAVPITAFSPVVNEFAISNTRGTVAMAKLGGNPDSATNQWFVNLANNAANLDAQNGGFTVFGRVLEEGMAVLDAVAGLRRINFSSTLGSAFSATPTINYANVISPSIFVRVRRVTATTVADSDDDGLGDDWETANGLDPQRDQRGTLDMDGNAQTAALTDGLLVLRHLFGFRGQSLFADVVAADATRSQAAIEAWLAQNAALLDADASGEAVALTDGVLILRRMFAFTGAALNAGAVDVGCRRCDSVAVARFIDALR